MKRKLGDLEGRSKRNNLIFTELQKQIEADYETTRCRRTVDLIHNQLKIPEDIQFDRVHRMRKDPKSPIIARFTNFKDVSYVHNSASFPTEIGQATTDSTVSTFRVYSAMLFSFSFSGGLF